MELEAPAGGLGRGLEDLSQNSDFISNNMLSASLTSSWRDVTVAQDPELLEARSDMLSKEIQETSCLRGASGRHGNGERGRGGSI